MSGVSHRRASTTAPALLAVACLLGALGACVDDDNPGQNMCGGPDARPAPPDAGLDARPEAGPVDAGPDATPDAWVWVTAPCDATFIELPPTGETRNVYVNNWDRYVVYDDGRIPPGDPQQDVYLYDLHTCTEYQLTNAPGNQGAASIWETDVAWFNDHGALDWSGFTNDTFDISTATFGTMNLVAAGGVGAYNGRYVLTSSNEGEPDPTYTHPILVDLWTMDEVQVAETWQGAEHFSMSETHLAWIMSCAGCGGVSDVFYMDLATKDIVHIEDTVAGNQLFPSTWGDYILWQDDRETGNWTIYLHRFSTGESRKLIDDQVPRGYPHIRGNLVTWAGCMFTPDCFNGGGDVILYDIETDVVRRVTPIPGYYKPRFAHGEWLVYLLSVGGDGYKMYGVHMQAAGLVDQDGHVIPE
jgi:hypothetical protein